MEIHVQFKGTLKQFIPVVAILMQRWRQLGHKSPIDFGPCASGPDPEWLAVELSVDSPRVITFKPVRVIAHHIPGDRSELVVVCPDKYWPDFEPTWKILFDALVSQGWVDDPANPAPEPEENPKTPGGRHTLEPDELVYRLAKAEEAEEMKARDPGRRWKEIALEIGWNKGSNTSGLKLLQYARERLAEARKRGDQALLDRVKEKRKEMKKTK